MAGKHRLTLIVLLGVGLIMIALWARFVDLDTVAGYMGKLRISWVILAGILYLLAYFARSLRWRMLLTPVAAISPRKTFALLMAGNLLNYLVPIRAGELAKSYFLKKTDGVSMARSLSSVFVDKLFDSVAIIVVLILLPFLHVQVPRPILFLIFCLIAVVLTGALILVMAAVSETWVVKFLHRLFFWMPGRFHRTMENYIHIFVQGVGLFRHHLNLLPVTIALTFIAVVLDSLYFSCVFHAFQESVSFPVILFGYTLIYLSFIFPHPPAQIGSNEVLMVLIFSAGLGLNRDMVSAVMVFAHLYTGMIITVTGVLGISVTGVKVISALRDEMTDNGEPT